MAQVSLAVRFWPPTCKNNNGKASKDDADHNHRIFNRETREDGGMPIFERAYLNETFLHTGLGIGIIGVAASALHRSGWSYRLMATNPWLVAGLGLVGSIGSMYGCMAIHPDK